MASSRPLITMSWGAATGSPSGSRPCQPRAGAESDGQKNGELDYALGRALGAPATWHH